MHTRESEAELHLSDLALFLDRLCGNKMSQTAQHTAYNFLPERASFMPAFAILANCYPLQKASSKARASTGKILSKRISSRG